MYKARKPRLVDGILRVLAPHVNARNLVLPQCAEEHRNSPENNKKSDILSSIHFRQIRV
jgi:hypothetical protein